MLLFEVKGMTCGHCERAVEKAIAGLPGVEKVDKIDRETGQVWVEGSPDTEAVKNAIRAEGYEVEEVRASPGP